MIRRLINLFTQSKDNIEIEQPIQKDPIKDLDEILNQALEEWKVNNPESSKTLECWIARKDNLEGTTWICRLQPQQPIYAIKRTSGV